MSSGAMPLISSRTVRAYHSSATPSSEACPQGVRAKQPCEAPAKHPLPAKELPVPALTHSHTACGNKELVTEMAPYRNHSGKRTCAFVSIGLSLRKPYIVCRWFLRNRPDGLTYQYDHVLRHTLRCVCSDRLDPRLGSACRNVSQTRSGT